MTIKDYGAGPAPAIRPAFATIDDWMVISGMRRNAVYDDIADGKLKAVKRGTRTLIDVEAGLAYLHSLPPAKVRGASKTRRPAGEQAVA